MTNLEILIDYQRWRRGEIIALSHDDDYRNIGIAIDDGIAAMREVEALRDEIWIARRCGIKQVGEIIDLNNEIKFLKLELQRARK